ncbi:MAG: hypothetical protein NC320_10155 [Clostridium sp.]|nr:hypothetical protein [Clostridium sp.]MCM1548045.1 hypothetical protein [Ruminococcus sp.]
MKRISIILCCISALILFAGCASDNKDANADDIKVNVNDDIKVDVGDIKIN